MPKNSQSSQIFWFSIIGNEEQMTAYELHIGVKDYCFAGADQLIGVSVMQLKDILDQVTI